MRLKIATMKIDQFRNIQGVELKFGAKMTMISGQNGVGKSNILSLIASGTGTSRALFNADLTSTDAEFQPNFMDYFVINTNNSSLEPFHDYKVFSNYVEEAEKSLYITKYLRFKDDSNQESNKKSATGKRPVRIIPTTVLMNSETGEIEPLKDGKSYSQEHGFSYEGRLKAPTQFLSISRLVPRGELSVNSEALSKTSAYITANEHEKYMNWYNEVVPGSISSSTPYMTSKGSFAKTVDEVLDNTTLRSISVGQDSLSKIISSLVNFDMIKEDPEYHGGILCIDEFDISLHPDAQNRLLSLLYQLSDELKIQIFLTTHSTTAIKKFFQMKKSLGAKQDALEFAYIQDRKYPHLMENPSFDKIAADLALTSSNAHPNIKRYEEDEWTNRLFELLIESCQSLELLKKYNPIYVKNIPATFGKSNLEKLQSCDNNFQESMIILDGDANYSDSKNFSTSKYILGLSPWPADKFKTYYANVVALPFPFSPEAFIYYLVNQYVRGKSANHIREFWINAETNIPFGRQFIDERLLLKQAILNEVSDSLNTDFLKGKGTFGPKMKLSAEDFDALNGYGNHNRDDRMKILYDIVKETHMCTDFYQSSSERLELLKNFALQIDRAYQKCQTIALAKRL